MDPETVLESCGISQCSKFPHFWILMMDEIRLKDMQILEFGTIILPQVVKNKKNNNNKKKTIVKI